ncbi:hypothetical protein BGZ58_010990 [Dissophora ornata]|nr:hypothetical protein BGZ58_010990 [Dissophora ornata]
MATHTSNSQQDCNCANRAEWDLHPNTNRAFENSDSKQAVQHTHTHAVNPDANANTSPKASATCRCGKNEWDMHPAAIRKIENEGSPEDVKLLHELEHPDHKH